MKHLESFNKYNPVELFLQDKISEETLFNYLDSLNEDLLDFLKSFKQKVVDVFWTILTKSVIVGFKILQKVKSIFSWIINKIKSFKEKNPVLFKVLVITILVVLILIISGNVAHAATTGKPIEIEYIDLAIGLINDMKEHGGLSNASELDVAKATAYLIKLRDAGGVINPNDTGIFGQDVVTLAHKAIDVSNKLVQDSKVGDKATMDRMKYYCIEMLEKGEKFIGYEYQKLSTGETIRLSSK
jgi:hypothetical protein